MPSANQDRKSCKTCVQGCFVSKRSYRSCPIEAAGDTTVNQPSRKLNWHNLKYVPGHSTAAAIAGDLSTAATASHFSTVISANDGPTDSSEAAAPAVAPTNSANATTAGPEL